MTANPRDSSAAPAAASPLQQQLLELALDAQSELRHLIRLLSPGPQASAVELVEFSTRTEQTLDALTAGLVMLARQRGIPWKVLAAIFHVSPESARRTYHEHQVQVRLQELAGSSEMPCTATTTPQPSAEGADAPEAPPPPQPVRPPRRAASQLAPVLSQLQRESRMPLRQLGLRAQVSPSYLSRVFSGEKFPTWDLTEKLAVALGADSESLHKVWQDEHARTTAASTPRDQPPEDLSPLHSALRTLSRRASSPSPRMLAAATGGDLTEQQIREVFRGSRVPDWPQTQNLVLALDGEPTFFRPLWEEATHMASSPGPRPADTPGHRINRLLMAFGDVLNPADQLSVRGSTRRARARAIRQRLANRPM
ncbi:helix-turn-helix transcriptional regulator [Streptomyces sp. NPDC002994]|uniref:helix-turn-helix domain-containing protein n=1 Tax=Streptomyces sp. NPDC002994 TaxID=3154441 RepID=UPI0033B14DDE